MAFFNPAAKGHGCSHALWVRERAWRLNRRIEQPLEAFLDQRYGEKTGMALPWMEELRSRDGTWGWVKGNEAMI